MPFRSGVPEPAVEATDHRPDHQRDNRPDGGRSAPHLGRCNLEAIHAADDDTRQVDVVFRDHDLRELTADRRDEGRASR